MSQAEIEQLEREKQFGQEKLNVVGIYGPVHEIQIIIWPRCASGSYWHWGSQYDCPVWILNQSSSDTTALLVHPETTDRVHTNTNPTDGTGERTSVTKKV